MTPTDCQEQEKYLTEKSLSEQLGLNDHEIEYRKNLFYIDEHTVQSLKDTKELVSEHLNDIVEKFYYRQKKIKAVELLIGDMDTFKKLKVSMKRYILEIFEGYYDKEYINSRLRIGKVHKRIGVSPKFYVSAVYSIEEILVDYIIKYSPESATLTKEKCSACNYRVQALHKILMFDIQLVFDTYINNLVSEVDAAKNEVIQYAEGLEEIVKDRTQQLEELSRKDMLTGLFNQRFFYDQIRLEIARAERGQQKLSLVYFDLNRFKNINDTRGHKAGDALLALVGDALRSELRQIDMAFRYGGDEFCIVMPATGSDEAEIVCRRICDNFDKRDTHSITWSIGIAEVGSGKYLDMDQLVRMADKAMYDAKSLSRERPGHHIRIFREEE